MHERFRTTELRSILEDQDIVAFDQMRSDQVESSEFHAEIQFLHEAEPLHRCAATPSNPVVDIRVYKSQPNSSQGHFPSKQNTTVSSSNFCAGYPVALNFKKQFPARPETFMLSVRFTYHSGINVAPIQLCFA